MILLVLVQMLQIICQLKQNFYSLPFLLKKCWEKGMILSLSQVALVKHDVANDITLPSGMHLQWKVNLLFNTE